jgi:hypothetical protein
MVTYPRYHGYVTMAKSRAAKNAYLKNWRQRNREKHNDYCKKWRKAHPEQYAAVKRKNRTGWGSQEYETAWKKQAGCCAICNIPMTKYAGKLIQTAPIMITRQGNLGDLSVTGAISGLATLNEWQYSMLII